jgi:3-oxoacyl-[acyl-carrier-protein] synthase III
VHQRILKQNGIQFRHYAIDRQQRSLFSHAEMTAEAARCAVAGAGLTLVDVDLIAAATSLADFLLPGFASMMHGELQSPPYELSKIHGVCASGLMAI